MPKKNTVIANSLPAEGYKLEQVVVLSRHNIRAPLSSGSSVLGTITPHEWFKWSANPSVLSLRGGILETEMGQYFRVWLEDQGLFPEHYRPDDGSVRIYANGRQRTIATANYFVSGLLPAWDATIETHVEFDKMDPVFEPRLIFVSPSYNAAAEKQIRELFGGAIEGLADNYKLLANVIDLEQSEAFKDGTFKDACQIMITTILNAYYHNHRLLTGHSLMQCQSVIGYNRQVNQIIQVGNIIDIAKIHYIGMIYDIF